MRQRHHLILSLASLAALGPLTFAAFLPALPALGKEFSLALPAAQALLAVYMAALASAHLLAAWLANALGKRSVLMAGAVLLTIGSAVCALASWPSTLQAGRILQGLGAGCVAALLPLLLHNHAQRAPRLLLDGLIPVLAPLAGALCVLFADWRYVFWLAAVAGLLVLYLMAATPAAAARAGEKFQFGELAGNATFWRYTACHALCFGALVAATASLPILVSLDLGHGADRIAWLQAAGAVAMLLPMFGSAQAEPGQDPMSMRVAAGLFMMGLAALAIAAWEGLERGIDPFNYLLVAWVAFSAGLALCLTPLAAGALKAAGQQARAALSLLQFASHACAAAALQLTASNKVEDAAIFAFGSALLMVATGGLLLPRFIWRSVSSAR